MPDIDHLEIQISATVDKAKASIDGLTESIAKLKTALNFGNAFAGITNNVSGFIGELSKSPEALKGFTSSLKRIGTNGEGFAEIAKDAEKANHSISEVSKSVKAVKKETVRMTGLKESLSGFSEIDTAHLKKLDSIAKDIATDFGVKDKEAIRNISKEIGTLAKEIDKTFKRDVSYGLGKFDIASNIKKAIIDAGRKIYPLIKKFGKLENPWGDYGTEQEKIYKSIRSSGSKRSKIVLGSKEEFEAGDRRRILNVLGHGFKFGKPGPRDVGLDQVAADFNSEFGQHFLDLSKPVQDLTWQLYELALAARNANKALSMPDAIKKGAVSSAEISQAIVQYMAKVGNLQTHTDKNNSLYSLSRQFRAAREFEGFNNSSMHGRDADPTAVRAFIKDTGGGEMSRMMRNLRTDALDQLAAKTKELPAIVGPSLKETSAQFQDLAEKITKMAFLKDVGGNAMSIMMKNLRTDAIEQFTERIKELPAIAGTPLEKTSQQFYDLSYKISEAMKTTEEEIAKMKASEEFSNGFKFNSNELKDIANNDNYSNTFQRMAQEILRAREELAQLFVQSDKLEDVAIGSGVSTDTAEIADAFKKLDESIEITVEDIRMYEKELAKARAIRSPLGLEDYGKDFVFGPDSILIKQVAEEAEALAKHVNEQVMSAFRKYRQDFPKIEAGNQFTERYRAVSAELKEAFTELRKMGEESAKLNSGMINSTQEAEAMRDRMSDFAKAADEAVKKIDKLSQKMKGIETSGKDVYKRSKSKPTDDFQAPAEVKRVRGDVDYHRVTFPGAGDGAGLGKDASSGLNEFAASAKIAFGEIAKGVGQAVNGFMALSTHLGGVTKLFNGLGMAAAKFSKVLLSAGMNAIFTPLIIAGKAVHGIVSRLGGAFKKLKAQSADSLKKATALMRRMGTMLKFMIIRKALYAVIRNTAWAVQSLAQFSDKVGTLFNPAISNLQADAKWIAKSIVGAFEPLVNAIAPIIDYVSAKLNELLTVVGHFFAALTGQRYYMKAKKNVENYAKSLDDTKKAQKAFLLDIDELNVMPDNSAANGENDSNPLDEWDTAPVEKNMKDLADDVKDIFAKIFDPFKKAWDAAKDYVMGGISHMANSLKKLFKDIGRDFLAVWNQPETVDMLTELLLILGDIAHTIGYLSDAFDKAWNKNNIGKKNLEAIRDILATIIHHIRIATEDTKNWAKELDFYPLLHSMRYMLVEIGNALDPVLQTLNLMYRDVILPMGTWVIEKGLPKIERIIGKVSTGFGNLATNFNKAWEYLGFGEKLVDSLTKSFGVLLTHIDKAAISFVKWSKTVNFEPLLSSFNALVESFESFADFIGGVFEDIVNKFVLPFGTALIEDILPKVNEGVANFMNSVDWDSLREHLSKIWEAAEHLTEALAGGLADAIGIVGQSAASFINSDQFKEFLDNIANFMNQVDRETVAKIFTALGEAILDVAKAVTGFVNSKMFQDFLQGILDYFHNASSEDIKKKIEALGIAILGLNFAKFAGPGLAKFMTFLTLIKLSGIGAGISAVVSGIASLGKALAGIMFPVGTFEPNALGASVAGIGAKIVAFMNADIVATVTAGSFGAAAATIGIMIVGGVMAWLKGNEAGKKIGAALFPEDKDLYENFKWLGEGGFFDQMFSGDIFADLKDAFDGLTLMITDFKNNPVIATLASVFTGPIVTASAHINKFIKDGGLDKIKEKFAALKPAVGAAWDGLKEKASSLGETIKNAFGGAADWVENTWATVSGWFDANVIQPIVGFFERLWTDVSGFFKQLWDDIVAIWDAVSGWFDATVIQPVVGFFKQLWTDVSGYFKQLWDDISAVWNTVCGWFTEYVIDPVKNAFDTAAKFIGEKFDAVWEGLKTGVKGCMNTVVTTIEAMINNVIKTLNMFLKGLNVVIEKAGEIAGKDWKGIELIKEVELPRFAAGGFPEDGLFMANHNELVGKFSNGKTAVANNEQILSGIRSAVEAGMASALSKYGTPGNITVKAELDGRVLYENVVTQSRREVMRTGSSRILGLA